MPAQPFWRRRCENITPRLSNATCSQLYDTVLDVEAYPAYLPFCMSASVLQRVEHADGLELLADFQVGGV